MQVDACRKIKKKPRSFGYQRGTVKRDLPQNSIETDISGEAIPYVQPSLLQIYSQALNGRLESTVGNMARSQEDKLNMKQKKVRNNWAPLSVCYFR